MDLDFFAIAGGFLISIIGFSIFLYGKKQGRIPPLVAGVLMMVLPYLGLDPWLLWTAGAALVAGLWFAVRAGH